MSCRALRRSVAPSSRYPLGFGWRLGLLLRFGPLRRLRLGSRRLLRPPTVGHALGLASRARAIVRRHDLPLGHGVRLGDCALLRPNAFRRLCFEAFDSSGACRACSMRSARGDSIGPSRAVSIASRAAVSEPNGPRTSGRPNSIRLRRVDDDPRPGPRLDLEAAVLRLPSAAAEPLERIRFCHARQYRRRATARRYRARS